ncbi:hypothetical protein [Planctomyces sp. SH-PL14]|uniref:hypothetical protein n=1 Tax=Planctomyces sp. SH-PL14 TaxID=1632864 RepID=UPI00078DD603|nr:hypothetical protein [Planctomyces sp. SH-PL14]AMV18263.1 hypothetical protein VT03_10265 [Planctomyces sp. SH-PL14]
MADIVYDLAADTAKFEAGMLNAAAGLEKFSAATREDHTSGLIRKLQQLEAETSQLKGEFTAAELAVAKFAKQDGVSPEMIARLRQAHVELEAQKKQLEANAAAEKKAAKDKVDAEKAAQDAIAAKRQQADQMAEARRTAQQRKDDANVARQLEMQRQAQQVKDSLQTREQLLAKELLRLQELHNRGLLTEIELKKASASARVSVGGGFNGAKGGFIAQQGAIGMQDAMSAYSVSGSAGMAVSAMGNNAIQMASLFNPIAGTIAAITVLAVQLGIAFGKSKDEAAKLKAEVEGIGKAVDLWKMSGDDILKQLPKEQESLANNKKVDDRIGGEIARRQAERDKLAAEIEKDKRAFVAKYGPAAIPRHDRQGELDQQDSFLAGLKEHQEKLKAEITAQQVAIDLAQPEFRAAGGVEGTPEWEARTDKEHAAAMGEMTASGELQRIEEEKQLKKKAADEEKKQKEELLALMKQEQEIQKRLAEQEAAAAKAVKDSLMTNQQRADMEADRLLKMEAKGLLSRNDVVGAMQKYIGGMSAPPTIAQGLVRGSVEEVRASRLDAARSEQREMIDKQVETTLAIREQTVEIRALKNKYEAPETGSEA